MRGSNRRAALFTIIGLSGFWLAPFEARAQGCEPIRFTTPVSLGGAGEAYQRGHEWELTLAYRRLLSNQWFIGTEESSSQAPGGSAPIFKIHTVVADVAYAFSDRVRAHVSIPFSRGSFSRKWADNAVHTQSATGIGDATVLGEAWIFSPRAHPHANVALGFGVKAPTGSHTKPSQFYLGSGAVAFPADQTIQPGDGGWGLLAQLQTFAQISDRTTLYGSGSYMASPKALSDIKGAPVPAPNSSLYWSVPDVYSGRTGVAFDALPEHGVSMSLGARVDGIPVHDLIGGGDDNSIKRTSYIVYAEPGLSYTQAKNTFTVSVPWRVKLNRIKSLTEQQPGALPNAGGFAKYLVFASYSRRF